MRMGTTLPFVHSCHWGFETGPKRGKYSVQKPVCRRGFAKGVEDLLQSAKCILHKPAVPQKLANCFCRRRDSCNSFSGGFCLRIWIWPGQEGFWVVHKTIIWLHIHPSQMRICFRIYSPNSFSPCHLHLPQRVLMAEVKLYCWKFNGITSNLIPTV